MPHGLVAVDSESRRSSHREGGIGGLERAEKRDDQVPVCEAGAGNIQLRTLPARPARLCRDLPAERPELAELPAAPAPITLSARPVAPVTTVLPALLMPAFSRAVFPTVP